MTAEGRRPRLPPEDDVNPRESLSQEEITRYSRHLLLPEVGTQGQTKLKRASVLVVGAGGLGSPAGLYLAAAGVGRIGLVDFDVVDPTNLQRQVLYDNGDIGRPKLLAAEERLREINPHISIELHDTRLTAANALGILREYDIVLDGTDNFPTRYLVSDACVLLGKPNIYGSVFRFEGQASVFWADRGPCYRCLFPEPPPPGVAPSCAEGGVLGILPGTIGAIQVTESLKLILGRGESLVGRLLLFNALEMRFRELRLHKDPDCPVCGEHPSIRELIDYEQFCGVSGAAELAEVDRDAMTPPELKARIDDGTMPLMLDVRSPQEWAICRIEPALRIPFGELRSRLEELPARDEIVCICRGGVRSARATMLLRELGIAGARNLRGGLKAWAEQVDPTMPRY
jgi:adenylyltransferase/sulfurtransferase